MATAVLTPPQTPDALSEEIRRYWDAHIHDLKVVKHPVGTRGFFEDLDEYRFDKLRYLPRVVDFSAAAGKELLEIGCGAGIDLARFAKHGARVTGVDLSATAIALAQQNFAGQGLEGDLRVMDGENLAFEDNRFDMVYAHGVLPYAARPDRLVREMRRVLRPGGQGILMAYNKYSWLNALSRVMRVDLEHEDAPVLRKFSISEIRRLLRDFAEVRIVVERFPVKSRLHGGLKGQLYNTLFVGAFNALPRAWVGPLGWHIMAMVRK
jgi:SAM-dependent methyltransferase